MPDAVFTDEAFEKPPPRPAASYATVYPRLCEVARPLGYALALHGSMNRDMDVIAAPWTEDAAPAEELVGALAAAISGFASEPEDRPHGRRAWQVHWRTGGQDYVDLSVMPLRPSL